MRVDPIVICLVLLAAVMHASWNAVVKTDRARLASMGIVMLRGAVFCRFFVPFVKFPLPAAWPWLLSSVIIHNFYFFFLLSAYAHGDLSHVYPIARGLGPVLVAIFSSAIAGEQLSAIEAGGVTLVSMGILTVALANGVPRGADWRPTIYALITGVTIAGYTFSDGLGARHSGDAFGYIVWLNLFEGPWVIAFALWKRGALLGPYLAQHWKRNVGGGIIATLGYGIAIWALSQGAMAHVAALRETSVIFAALMGTLLLREAFGLRRVLAAFLVVAGLLLMNLPIGR
jgi:drug/metabolite transporter (DMT)-like permease